MAIQVKGGLSFRRSSGYGVPIKQHARDWSESTIPVACVVYDPDLRALYWANASGQLQESAGRLRTVLLDESDVLNDYTIDEFVFQMRTHARGTIPTVRSSVSSPNQKAARSTYFVRAARWIERYPEALRRSAIALFGLIGVGAFAWMAPLLWKFSEAHLGLSPIFWVGMIIGYTLLGIGLFISEARRGRRSRLMSAIIFIPLFIAYYSALAEDFGLLPGLAGDLVASAIPNIVKYSMLFGVTFFIGRELDRRRRLRKLGRDPDDPGVEEHE